MKGFFSSFLLPKKKVQTRLRALFLAKKSLESAFTVERSKRRCLTVWLGMQIKSQVQNTRLKVELQPGVCVSLYCAYGRRKAISGSVLDYSIFSATTVHLTAVRSPHVWNCLSFLSLFSSGIVFPTFLFFFNVCPDIKSKVAYKETELQKKSRAAR